MRHSRAFAAFWPLIALNFFMADMQAGVGPFLGVFLQAHGWQTGLIGTVMTIDGVAGVLATAPAGAAIDATKRKRAYVIVYGVCTLLASGALLLSREFWVVAGSQIASAIAGAAIMPAVAGITLGLVKQNGFNRQNGLNQASNHAGNMVGAALSGYLGWRFGFPAVFLLAGLFGVFTIASILLIAAKDIDHDAARGIDRKNRVKPVGSFQVLLECKPLLILAAALAAFHLGNGAMLPLFGLAVVAVKHANGPGFTALTIVVAQATMILTSLIAMRMSESKGYWLVILISFSALPLRGWIAAEAIAPWGVWPVQILDGVGAGLQSVAVPGLVARMLNGTGRVNLGQGAVMMVQGIGASLSPALGGWIAQEAGYASAFLALGALALISIILWLWHGTALRKACAPLLA
ncbi:MAG: MFS transporter [Rhizomicrobium sp.]